MRKILFCLMAILPFVAFSGEKFKRLTCPESILCNYEKNICLYPENYPYQEDWILNSPGAKESFKGARKLRFTMVTIIHTKPRSKLLACYYYYGNNSYFVARAKNYVSHPDGIGWYSLFTRPGVSRKYCNGSSGADQCAAWVIKKA